MSVAGGGGLSGLSSGTWAIWVQWTGVQPIACCGLWGSVFARSSSGSWLNDVLGLDGANPATSQIVYYHSDMSGLAGNTFSSNFIPGVNTWHFIAATWSNDDVSLYVDGLLTVSGFSEALRSDSIVPLVAGGWPGGGGYMKGTISDFAVWNSSLTQAQLQTLQASLSQSAYCG